MLTLLCYNGFMSVLYWSGYKNLKSHDAEEAVPYALPIIVRLEKTEPLPTHEEVLSAVAYGVTLFFDDARTAPGGWWHNQTLKWLDGRIRKVVRRARGIEWENIKAMEGIYVKKGNAEVFILPPHPVDETPAQVKKLQVSGLELNHDETYMNENKGLMITVNPALGMSTGKIAAQVGHAVQLAIFNSPKNKVNSWRENNFRINLCNWSEYDDWTAVVHDAGFTEIPAGSETSKSKLLY